MSENRDMHFRKIQSKLAESLTDEDANFLESYLAEQDSQETEEEVGEPEVYEDENGNLYAATGEIDEEGNPIMIDEDGQAVVLPGEEYAEEEAYFDGAEDGSDDEVGIQEFAEQYPALASEIDADYAGMEESMDPALENRLVEVEAENRLLKSREIASAKLAEAEQVYGLPEGIVLMKELVGKSPDDMDTILESRIRTFNAMAQLTEGAVAGVTEATTLRESTTVMIGKRLLRNSTLPF